MVWGDYCGNSQWRCFKKKRQPIDLSGKCAAFSLGVHSYTNENTLLFSKRVVDIIILLFQQTALYCCFLEKVFFIMCNISKREAL